MATRITTSGVNKGPERPKSSVTKAPAAFVCKDGMVTLNVCGMMSMLDDSRIMPHLTKEVRSEADSILQALQKSTRPRKLSTTPFVNRSIANVTVLGHYSKMPVLSAFEWILWASDMISSCVNYIVPSSKRSIGSILLNSASGYKVSVLQKSSNGTQMADYDLELSSQLMKLLVSTENIINLARDPKKIDLAPNFGGTLCKPVAKDATPGHAPESVPFSLKVRTDRPRLAKDGAINNFSTYVLSFLGEICAFGETIKDEPNLVQLVDMGFYQGQIPAELAVCVNVLIKLDSLIKLYGELSNINVTSADFWQTLATDLCNIQSGDALRKYCSASIHYEFESFWLAPEYRESEKLSVPPILASYLPDNLKKKLGVATVEDYLNFARSIRYFVLEQTQLKEIREKLSGQSDIVQHTSEGPVFTDKLLSVVADAIYGRSESTKLLFEEQALFDYKEGKLAEVFAHFIMADCAGLSIKGVDYHKYMPLMACFFTTGNKNVIYGPAQGDRLVRSVIEAYTEHKDSDNSDKDSVLKTVLSKMSNTPSEVQLEAVESFADSDYLSAVVTKDVEKYGRYFDFHIDILKAFYEPVDKKLLPSFTPKYVSHEGLIYCERLEARFVSSISHAAGKFHRYSIGGSDIAVLCTKTGDGSIYSDSISDDFDIVQESGYILPPAEPIESKSSSEDNPVERPIPGFFTDVSNAKGVLVDECKAIYHFGPRVILQNWPFKLTNKEDYSEDDALSDLIKLYKFKSLMRGTKFEYTVNEDFSGETVLRKATLFLKMEPVSIRPPASGNTALKYKPIGMHDSKSSCFMANTYLTEDRVLNPEEIESWSFTDTLFVYDKAEIEKVRAGVSVTNPKDCLFDLYRNRFDDIIHGLAMAVRIVPNLITTSVEPMAIKTQFAVNGLARGKYLAIDGVDQDLTPKPVISLAYGFSKDQLKANTTDGKVRSLRWSPLSEQRYFRQRWLVPVQDLPESISDVVRDGETYVLRMPGKNPKVDVMLKISPFDASPIYAEVYQCIDLKAHGFKAARAGAPSSNEKLAQYLNLEVDGKKPTVGLYSNEYLQVDVLPLPGLYPKSKSTWFTLFDPDKSAETNGSLHIAAHIKPSMYLHDANESGFLNALYLLRNLVRELDFFFCGLPSYSGEKTKFPLRAVLTQLVDFVEGKFSGISGDSIYVNDYGFSSGCTLRQMKKAISDLVKCFCKFTETNGKITFNRVEDKVPSFILEEPVELDDTAVLGVLKALRSDELDESGQKTLKTFTSAMDTAYSVVTGSTHERTLYFTHIPGEFICTNLLYDTMNSLISEVWNYWDIPFYGARLDICSPSELGLNLSTIAQGRTQQNFYAHGINQIAEWLTAGSLSEDNMKNDNILHLSDDIKDYLEEQEKAIGIKNDSYIGLSIPSALKESTSDSEMEISAAVELQAPEEMLDDIFKAYDVKGSYAKGTVILKGMGPEGRLRAMLNKMLNDGVFKEKFTEKFSVKYEGPKYLENLLKTELNKSYEMDECKEVIKKLQDKYGKIASTKFICINTSTGNVVDLSGESKVNTNSSGTSYIIVMKEEEREKYLDAAKVQFQADVVDLKDLSKWDGSKNVIVIGDPDKIKVGKALKDKVIAAPAAIESSLKAEKAEKPADSSDDKNNSETGDDSPEHSKNGGNPAVN